VRDHIEILLDGPARPGLLRQELGMRNDQPYNMAIAEARHDGRVALITGSAATENDDAIQFIVDLMAQEGIVGDDVLQLDSERRPSPEWCAHFAAHWPNAAITWSFEPGEEAKMEAAVEKLHGGSRKPWWRFR
jgi:hypothetical protein